ncbi:MAG: hypothetical protein M1818_003416 [Claussenomyces sp. TS43310]|nr:MAG: hypothetical protein M1818_003416 [Claussenomyces sp. TS43310]
MGSIVAHPDEDASALPYWQVNVPAAQRPTSCPPFLQNLNAADTAILATPDADYRIMSWPDVRAIIAGNELEKFQRIPSELRRYFEYGYNTRRRYGSMMNFILKVKLGWQEPIVPAGGGLDLFGNGADWTVKYNDWPYGIDERIVHLVVWTKFDLPEDPNSPDGDLTDDARREIDHFVDETFRKKLGENNVVWFKNWKSLKSVHAVEHFHVMLFDPPPEFVEEITHGDVPISTKL